MENQQQNRRQFIKKTNCPLCNSSDANAVYDDGSAFCYSCNKPTSKPTPEQFNTTKKGGGDVTNKIDNDYQFPKYTTAQKISKNLLAERGINHKTVEKYDVEFSKFGKEPVIIYNYFNEHHEKHGKKVRYYNKKDFLWQGDTKHLMFGQQLYKSGGRQIIITEGEIDALSISQSMGYNIATISVSRGAQSAKNELLKHFEYLNSFSTITLAFDNDEPGRKAVEECASIFEPGKVNVVKFKDYKDANEYLKFDKILKLKQLIMNAETYRPDGIIDANDIDVDWLMSPIEKGLPYKFPKLQKLTYGMREKEITMITAGSGIGKSTIVRQIAYDIRKLGRRVGMVFLEEDIKKTTQGFIALDNNIPLNIFRQDPTILSRDQVIATKNELFKDGLFLYDHFGSLDSENLLNKIRYMKKVLDIDILFLDHISIIVSGNKQTDERKELDIIMTKLRTITEETGLAITAIVHLRRKNSGVDFNEGGQVSLTDLRGSASLEQLSDCVIALERNQQSTTNEESNILQIRVLKNREMGEVGLVDTLRYNKENGKLELSHEEITDEDNQSVKIDTKNDDITDYNFTT